MADYSPPVGKIIFGDETHSLDLVHLAIGIDIENVGEQPWPDFP